MPREEPLYKIDCSEYLLRKLDSLNRIAAEQGREPEWRSALKLVLDQLAEDPIAFGEPRFTLHGLSLKMRVGAIAPLAVSYGVEEERRLVFVQDFYLLTQA